MFIICDLQRRGYLYIPEILFSILTFDEALNVEQVYEKFNHEHDDAIKKYFDMLAEKEFGFYTNEPDAFPAIDFTFQSPGLINNAIIDIARSSDHDYKNIFLQLESLGCTFLQLRFFDVFSAAEIRGVVNFTKKTRFRNVDLFIRNYHGLTDELILADFLFEFQNIGTVVVSESEVCKTDLFGSVQVIHTPDKLDSETCCGNISIGYFSYSLETFSEAQTHNTCLNKKISVDKNGNIKNCPSMRTSFGKIQEITLREVAEDRNFQNLFSIHKDQIAICRDCQFRYICTDCRAYLDDLYAKPLKCKYDPYQHVWNN